MLKRELPLCLSETVRVATVPDLCFNNPIDVTLHLVNLSFPTPPMLSLPHWQFITAYPELIQALHFWCKKQKTHFITFIPATPDICHKYHKLDMWRKICHVEKFQIYMHDRCGEI